jgi:hypothetical protein
MKKLSIAIALLLSASQLIAQDAKVNRENLRKLDFMTGNWKGEATIQQRGSAPIKVVQEEKIEWRLDSLLLTVEGTGRDPLTKKVNFHAFAIIAYNQQTKQLGMKSFTMEGRQTEAYFNVVADNQYTWGFDVPTGKIKYSITISPQAKTWVEKGEFSPDGTQWFPFMEMNLTKLN